MLLTQLDHLKATQFELQFLEGKIYIPNSCLRELLEVGKPYMILSHRGVDTDWKAGLEWLKSLNDMMVSCHLFSHFELSTPKNSYAWGTIEAVFKNELGRKRYMNVEGYERKWVVTYPGIYDRVYKSRQNVIY